MKAIAARFLPLCLALVVATAEAETWRFALIGDTPYSDYERHELPRMLDAIAAENVEFIIHAGDIKHGRTPCTDAVFADRKALFDATSIPLVFVPGDNEWTDCDRVSAGHHDPLERLAHLRTLFFADGFSLGRTRLALERQPGAFREHQRWRLGPVLFVTLNVPGGNNNWHHDGHETAEAAARMPAVLSWLREGFALARRQGLRGIVVTMQANPGFKHYRAGLPHGGYRTLLDALRAETLAFSGEVLLVHGDTHWQRVDQPLFEAGSGRRIANFTRAETFGYPYLGWTKVIVDSESPSLFRFETRAWSGLTP